jgi:hypothetical protein
MLDRKIKHGEHMQTVKLFKQHQYMLTNSFHFAQKLAQQLYFSKISFNRQ